MTWHSRFRTGMFCAATMAAPMFAMRGQNPAGTDSLAARVALGRSLFIGKGLCFSCHGKDGEGALGPATRLAARPLIHAKVTVEDIAALITSGVDSAHSTSGQVMPPRGGSRITDQEIDALARYILTLQADVKQPE